MNLNTIVLTLIIALLLGFIISFVYIRPRKQNSLMKALFQDSDSSSDSSTSSASLSEESVHEKRKSTVQHCPVPCSVGTARYTTYSQFDWHCNVCGILQSQWQALSAGQPLRVGLPTPFSILFTNPGAVEKFLPQYGFNNPSLGANFTDPLTTPAGNFAGEVTALLLNVFSSSFGFLPTGFGLLQLHNCGSLDGVAVVSLLVTGQEILSGQPNMIPAGYDINTLSNLFENLNLSFHQGTQGIWATTHLI